MSSWRFAHPTSLLFGQEWLGDLGQQVGAVVDGPIALMTGNGAARSNGYLEQVCAALGERQFGVFDQVEPEPSHSTVMAAKRFVEQGGFRGVLALGGGSTIDAAKAVTCLAYADAEITPYMDREREFGGKQVPLIALPTTAGTGSEVTPFSVLTNDATGEKKSLPSPHFYPDVALVLPGFLSTVPQKVIGDSGLDALAHAYEAVWSVNANPVSDALAFRAIKLITDNFVRHYRSPSDLLAATAMAEGATIAGMAFSNTLTAGCHALSYPIGRIFGLSHGASCAMTLHLVAEMNAAAVAPKFDLLATQLGLDDGGQVPGSILHLRQQATTIPTLRELGAGRAQLEEIATGAFQPLLKNNPVPMTEERIVGLLEPEIA